MTRPIGSKAKRNGKDVFWAGDDYEWQSPGSFQQLKDSGQLDRGAGFVRRVGGILDRLEQARHNVFGTDPRAVAAGQRLDQFVSQNTPVGIAEEGAMQGGAAIARRLGISPALGALLLGSVTPGSGEVRKLDDIRALSRIPNRASTGDPLASARSQITRTDPQNTSGLTVAPRRDGGPIERGSHPGDRTHLANQAESAITQRLDNQSQGVRTQAEVEELLEGVDVVREAKGPGQRQFGAYPKETTELQAITDRLGIKTPEHSRTTGRPSATNSMPGLLDVGKGKRKATTLQERRDYLNRGREGEKPLGPKPPKSQYKPLTPDERIELRTRKPTEAQVRESDAAAFRENSAQSPRGQTRPEEAVDFTRRRSGLNQGADRNFVRRNAQGEVIRDPKKPEPRANVSGSIPGERARPGQQQVPAADRSQQPYQGSRSSRDQGSGRSVKQESYSTGPGDQPFNQSGELKNIKTKGKDLLGDQRSPQQRNAARKSLENMITRMEAMPGTSSRTARIQRLKQQLQKLN